MGVFGGFIWIFKPFYSHKKGSIQNAGDIIRTFHNKIEYEAFFDLLKYFIASSPDPGSIFCTFFKTRSPDGHYYFTSFRSTKSNNVLDCYASLLNLRRSDYSHILKTKYLQEEKDKVYTFKSQINVKELNNDIHFKRKYDITFSIHKSEYLRFLKFLKSKEKDIQKKSFFTFFVGPEEIAIFTFDDVKEFLSVFANQKLQNMKYKEKFTQNAKALLFFYILENLVHLRNENLEPVLAH